LHVVGDSRTNAAAQIVAGASAEYSARHGQPVWAYTHAWRDVDRSSWGAVSVLASCETEQDVRDATARGYATALVWDTARPLPATVGDLKAWQCPQQTGARPDCARCQACTHDTALLGRATVIFAIHGNKKRAAAAVAGRGA
jgi:hypothetical protein